MLKILKIKFPKFLEQENLHFLWIGFICGFYPFVFYFSNNFASINSIEHVCFLAAFFIGIPLLLFTGTHFFFKIFKKYLKYKGHILFVLIILCVAALISQAMFLTLKKKMLLILFIGSILLSIKLYREYKKLLILILIMSIIPLLNCFINFYEFSKRISWTKIPDDIENVKFKSTPNIYMIQPDGYVSKKMMETSTYNYQSSLYAWLIDDDFKLYNDFRSNYPASLVSNASMFAMKHHYFGDALFPSLEMSNAREIINGDNAVISIFKNNNYKNFFIVQDDYFQQNKCEQLYDYNNIELKEIPLFSNGNNVKKDVFNDLKTAVQFNDTKQPKFFFIEKLLPHHVHFSAVENRIEKERKQYLEKIEEVNNWLKNTVNFIEKEDPNAIIIILSDHGGWVGIENYDEMYSTMDPDLNFSVFSALAAIKWNGFLRQDLDSQLKSNVNLFRVLFSVLSQNEKYLEHLEDDSSYNLHNEVLFYKSVYQTINDNGEPVNIKH